ncbi:MAG TPA: VOC family protein [Caulobacterales bacterium]|jgi:lactoylglutathione lyase|nr:VOC family protein [Caulobacterales bacterium]
MDLAKPHVDIGTQVRDTASALDFWQKTIGIPFEYTQPISKGVRQHRHDLYGSIVKVNNSLNPVPDNPPTGYRELLIAREGVSEPKTYEHEGVKVTLVPPGVLGVEKIGIRIACRDLAAHRAFFAKALDLREEKIEGVGAAFRAGDSIILIDQDAGAPSDAQQAGYGWRYITFQVFKVDQEHARALANGARQGRAPVTLGTTARISMIRDPDGNWIELSQRASITGSLEPS